MTVTKPVNKVSVDKKIIDYMVSSKKQKYIYDYNAGLVEFQNKFDSLTNEEFVEIKNKNILYIEDMNIIVMDTRRQLCSNKKEEKSLAGHNARLMSIDEAEKFIKKSRNPLIRYSMLINKDEKSYSYITFYNNGQFSQLSLNDFRRYWHGSGVVRSDSLNLPVVDMKIKVNRLALFLEKNFIPAYFNEKEEKLFSELVEMYKNKDVEFVDNTISITEKFKKKILSEFLDDKAILDDILSSTIEFKDNISSTILDKLLKCDYERAEIEPYRPKKLEDINDGHWDLWEDSDDDEITINIDKDLIARNPIADIRYDGIVGIDFGTKSTIVVYQNGDDNTLPMRVGSGRYKKELKKEDFENPTVMEFRDIESFLSDYNKTASRPHTKWEDMTVSHKASEQLKNGTDSSLYYTFFSDLKQWSADKSRQIRVKDIKGYELVLPAFSDISDDDFNPLEIYAYYLGLFINNMYNGIYINYILSFPVTYEKNVREKIATSFEKGIKKSLPKTVLESQEIMSKFRITQGASEPAAYAICALQEYGFDCNNDEKHYYGIFDFGGGTTDFDFGIWRGANDSESRRYDYVIKHFGAEGDRYLGGENLLELLAFNVFKNNKDNLLSSEISFFRPAECQEFAGQEMLISNSQEAKLNTKQLMEKLRGLWENDSEEDIEDIESGKIKLLLFKNDGETVPNFELSVDKEELIEILTNRIEKGVINFFEALKLTFNKEEMKDIKTINIFLAGNSSKSEIVTKLFDKHIEINSENIFNHNADMDRDIKLYNIYPPLGTDEAKKIQQERGIDIQEDNGNPRPTGKTGVAFGLIEGRKGSRIKVVSEIKNDSEIKFKYYIGSNIRGKFRVVIYREQKYNEWIEFTDASIEEFEFYYTSLPEVTSNEVSIKEKTTKNIYKKICTIKDINEDANVYIRLVSPSEIEYAVSKSKNDIDSGEYLETPQKINLG